MSDLLDLKQVHYVLTFTQNLHYGILMCMTFGFVPDFKMYVCPIIT